jgi:hypothetical protein
MHEIAGIVLKEKQERKSVKLFNQWIINLPVKNRHLLLMTALWVLFVLYPNPLSLGRSIQRTLVPPVQQEGVQHLLAEAPHNPEDLEQYVLETFPYQYDWVTYSMPWYFPTLEEALEQGAGDCKTRFVVLASLFEARGIPYQLSFSLSHFWVQYEGKEENSWEMEQNAFLVREEDGSVRLQVPREERSQVFQNFRDGFWQAMPSHRKKLLLTGPALMFLAGTMLYALRRKGNSQMRPVAADA